MALIDCPECKRQASDRATACPHCGYPLLADAAPAEPAKAPQADAPPAKAGDTKPGSGPLQFGTNEAVGLLLAAIMLLIGVSTMLGGGGATERDRRRPKGHGDRQAEAVAFCEQQMRSRLKAPGSADFPWGVTARAAGNQVYVVSSYVDARNSFGAELRTHYVCRAEYYGDTWDLVSFDVR